MTRRETQKLETRQKLLAAAAFCFAQKGFAACSVADIAARASVSQGNLYVHFKGKDELFKALIEEEFSGSAAKIRQAAEHSPSLQTIAALLKDCIVDVAFPMDHRLWVEFLALAGREPEIRRIFARYDRAMRDAFIALLEKAAAAGEIDSHLDFEAVSVWIYALADGLIARAADDDCFELERQLPWLEELVKRALLPPEAGVGSPA